MLQGEKEELKIILKDVKNKLVRSRESNNQQEVSKEKIKMLQKENNELKTHLEDVENKLIVSLDMNDCFQQYKQQICNEKKPFDK